MPDFVLLSDSPNIQKAVANKHIVNYPSRLDGNNSLNNFALRMNSSSAAAYNGYFTLKPLAQTEEELEQDKIRVAVCDGQTWDSVTEKSGYSAYSINDDTRYIASKIVTVNPDKPYIVLQHTIGKIGQEKITTLSLEEFTAEVPYPTEVYYLIGELSLSFEHAPRIIQRHGENPHNNENGMIRIWTVSDLCEFLYKAE